MKIKEWKLNQIKEEMNGGYLEEIENIERETEKAVLVKMLWGYTSNLEKTVKIWIPKSAIMTKADVEKENERFQAGCKAYNDLLAFAKENGLKVRKGMKKETILRIIKESGLVFNY